MIRICVKGLREGRAFTHFLPPPVFTQPPLELMGIVRKVMRKRQKVETTLNKAIETNYAAPLWANMFLVWVHLFLQVGL